MYKIRDKIKIKEQYIEYLCKYIKEKNLYNTKDKLSFQIPLPLEIIEPLQPSWIYQKGE